MSNKRITYNINLEKKLAIEKLAINASIKIGRTVKWTDIMEYLVDHYAKDAANDLIAQQSTHSVTKNL